MSQPRQGRRGGRWAQNTDGLTEGCLERHTSRCQSGFESGCLMSCLKQRAPRWYPPASLHHSDRMKRLKAVRSDQATAFPAFLIPPAWMVTCKTGARAPVLLGNNSLQKTIWNGVFGAHCVAPVPVLHSRSQKTSSLNISERDVFGVRRMEGRADVECAIHSLSPQHPLGEPRNPLEA